MHYPCWGACGMEMITYSEKFANRTLAYKRERQNMLEKNGWRFSTAAEVRYDAIFGRRQFRGLTDRWAF